MHFETLKQRDKVSCTASLIKKQVAIQIYSGIPTLPTQ